MKIYYEEPKDTYDDESTQTHEVKGNSDYVYVDIIATTVKDKDINNKARKILQDRNLVKDPVILDERTKRDPLMKKLKYKINEYIVNQINEILAVDKIKVDLNLPQEMQNANISGNKHMMEQTLEEVFLENPYKKKAKETLKARIAKCEIFRTFMSQKFKNVCREYLKGPEFEEDLNEIANTMKTRLKNQIEEKGRKTKKYENNKTFKKDKAEYNKLDEAGKIEMVCGYVVYYLVEYLSIAFGGKTMPYGYVDYFLHVQPYGKMPKLKRKRNIKREEDDYSDDTTSLLGKKHCGSSGEEEGYSFRQRYDIKKVIYDVDSASDSDDGVPYSEITIKVDTVKYVKKQIIPY
jgi:hypothetical protein